MNADKIKHTIEYLSLAFVFDRRVSAFIGG
jgi:hypothetical protein